ncbi:MAG TPA: RidA family protein [Ktedonobacterales bacterium]|nr:RidA family protein [Ktedonobacterales bacterium]
MSYEARLRELGLVLPETPIPAANYVPAVLTGNLIFVSGEIPTVNGQLMMQGKLGRDLSVEQGQLAARQALLNGLAAVRGLTGTLDAITRVVKLNGWVASAEGFSNQSQVVNGASLLLEEIFGDAGKHARASIGVAELPLGAPVELELIVEVKPS